MLITQGLTSQLLTFSIRLKDDLKDEHNFYRILFGQYFLVVHFYCKNLHDLWTNSSHKCWVLKGHELKLGLGWLLPYI